MIWKPIVLLSLALFTASACCGPRIGWLSRYEIADEIAKQYSVERAERWLAEEYSADEARRWREEYEQRNRGE